MTTKEETATQLNARAAKSFTRRTMLKSATTIGAVAVAGPWIVKDAFSS